MQKGIHWEIDETLHILPNLYKYQKSQSNIASTLEIPLLIAFRRICRHLSRNRMIRQFVEGSMHRPRRVGGSEAPLGGALLLLLLVLLQ